VAVSIQVLFLKAWLFTIAIETLLLFVVIRLWFKIPKAAISNALLLFAGIYCSATTLPYLWFVLPSFLSPYAVFLLVGETLVFLVEAVFYYFVLKIGMPRSLLVSLVCNAASFLGGLLAH
jgi:hypothetical protein